MDLLESIARALCSQHTKDVFDSIELTDKEYDKIVDNDRELYLRLANKVILRAGNASS